MPDGAEKYYMGLLISFWEYLKVAYLFCSVAENVGRKSLICHFVALWELVLASVGVLA